MNGRTGGNNTKDKIFLLSIAEINKSAYGFPDLQNQEIEVSDGPMESVTTKTLEAKNTAYAIKHKASTDGGKGMWWLRSPGLNGDYAANVYSKGNMDSFGYNVDDSSYAVRPALHLNLSSKTWKNASKAAVNIKPKKVALYNAKSYKSKTLDVSWESDYSATGYQLAAATNKQFTRDKASATIGKNLSETTLKKLKSGKTYYVKVRPLVKIGKTVVYGPYSKVKTGKVK